MADVASAEGGTNVAVVQRAYRRLDAILPSWINIAAQRLQHAFEAIRLTFPFSERMRFRLALKKLQRARSNIYYLYETRRDEYRKLHADAEQLRELSDNEIYELGTLDEKIHQLYSQHIIARAERYLLPIPEIQDPDGEWEIGRITGGFCLQREALSSLLSAIRVEQNHRREAAQAKLMWMAASTGLIGAITGLVAVLSR